MMKRYRNTLLALALSVLLPAGAFAQAAMDVSVSPVESTRLAYLEGRYQEAVLLVDRALAAESTLPGVVPELHFWRGAALRKLERPEEALVALETARKGGFSGPELALERAHALKALGRDQEADRAYQEADRLLEEEPERRLRFSEEWRRTHEKEPDFRLTLTPQLGYDSNIVGLDKDAPLAEGDLERDSFYYGIVLAAKYYLLKSDERVLLIEARSLERSYADEPDLGYTDNMLSILGRYPLGESFAFEARGGLGEAYVRGEGHARTVRTAGPALIYRLGDLWQIRLFGDWSDTDYYDADIPAEQDRDGVLQRGGLALGLDLGEGWSVGPVATLGKYGADGDGFDSRDWTLAVALTTGKYLGCVLSSSL